MNTRKNPSLMRKEVDEMSDKNEVAELLSKYVDLRRIISAEDPKKEAEYQLTLVKRQLEAYGDVSLEGL